MSRWDWRSWVRRRREPAREEKTPSGVSSCRARRGRGSIPPTSPVREALDPVLPHVDYFLPNDEEAQALTGEKDPRRQAERFLEAGCGTAIITQGDRGTLLMDAGRVLEAPVFPVEYVDGSGAGDAFAA